MLYAKFGWKWLSDSGEEFGQCIFATSLLSPLRKGQGPSFEQTWICSVSSLVEIDKVGPEEKFFSVLVILKSKVKIAKNHKYRRFQTTN